MIWALIRMVDLNMPQFISYPESKDVPENSAYRTQSGRHLCAISPRSVCKEIHLLYVTQPRLPDLHKWTYSHRVQPPHTTIAKKSFYISI